MSKRKKEYHQQVIPGVLALTGLRPTQAHLPADFLRSKLDALLDHIEMTAGTADYWLDLDQSEGAARRRALDPVSPFRKRHRAWIAAKGKIALWDLEWRKREVAQILKTAKSKEGAKLAEAFLAGKLPMVMALADDRDVVLGAADWMPVSAQSIDPATIDIRWLRPNQALKFPWHDQVEAQQFLALLRAAQALQADALETIQRDFSTAQATGRRNPQDGRL